MNDKAEANSQAICEAIEILPDAVHRAANTSFI